MATSRDFKSVVRLGRHLQTSRKDLCLSRHGISLAKSNCFCVSSLSFVHGVNKGQSKGHIPVINDSIALYSVCYWKRMQMLEMQSESACANLAEHPYPNQLEVPLRRDGVFSEYSLFYPLCQTFIASRRLLCSRLE